MKRACCLEFLFLLLILIFVGCAPKSKPKRILWPPPPEQPRLEWISAFDSAADFPKSEFQKAMKKVTGETADFAFSGPFAAASDGKGRVFVSDIYSRNVEVVDFVQQKIYPLVIDKVFGRPQGLAVDSQGQVYVADAGPEKRVLVLSPGGEVLRVIGSEEDFINPAFLAINEESGRLYVTDGAGHKVVVFDLKGERLFSFGVLGNEPGAFHSPQGVAIHSDGRVLVADLFNARIQVFDGDGNFLSQFGERGDQSWQFESPRGLAFDSEDHLYIADQRRSMLKIYSAEGDFLMTLGEGVPRGHRFGFVGPTSIQIDKNDRIVVADIMGRQLLIWQYLSEGYLLENPIEPVEK